MILGVKRTIVTNALLGKDLKLPRKGRPLKRGNVEGLQVR